MTIPALCLLPFLLATQLVAAASTDKDIIEARLNVLSESLSPQCRPNYEYCYVKYGNEHQGQQINYCQAVKESKSCGLSQNTYNGNTYGPCTESEYERVQEVGCMCKEELDAFRNLENMAPSLSENCANKAQSCTGKNIFSIGATIDDYCEVLQKNKQCFISGSNACSQETYDKFEAATCQVECGGIKIAQYSIFLIIITSFLRFL